jgi:succinate dehydrogenase / fumarate reductase iron-sulfur subunit
MFEISHFFEKLKLHKLNLLSTKFNLNNKENVVCYRILKYDPTKDIYPWIQVIFLENDKQFPMLLDKLLYIKDNKDSSLAFRRSCREGICGSCAMNINGVNGLARIYKIDNNIFSYKSYINVFPLPHMLIVKDLVVNMKHFYNQYKSINPFLIKNYSIFNLSNILIEKKLNLYNNIEICVSRPTIENIQTKKDRKLLDGLYECILCARCSTSCPSYRWNPNKYLGPAVLLQSYRWLIDSRDEDFTNRLVFLDDIYKLHRCHTILNCIRCCPKSLSPATAIANIKQIIDIADIGPDNIK